MENKEMHAAPKKGVIIRIIRTLFSFLSGFDAGCIILYFI